jgi:radical SAM protein with 4Fe4S-binding SPASM domain
METNLEKNKSKFDKFKLLFSRPAQVQIDITNRCNLNCLYCYNKMNSLRDRELSDDELRQIISKVITELNPLYVSFSGGEPLIRADLLIESIKKLKENKIGVHINTNSLLMTEDIAKNFGELKVDKININIDSLEYQDKLRGGKNLLKKTFNSLEILKKHFPKEKISIACVITKLNYKNCLEIAKFVKREGLMEIHLLDMIPCEKSSMDLFLSKEEWLEFFKIYKEIKDMGVKIKPNHALLFLGEFENQVKIPFCMAGRFKMVITADGKIVPCNYFKNKDFICGDALKENLLEVWQNSKIMNEFRYFIPKEEKCQKCKLVNLCTGGCRAMSLKLTGDAFKADPYCITYNLKDETQ